MESSPIEPKKEQMLQTPENFEEKELMENFYKKYFETRTEGVRKISLENLRELKEKGISTEQFLDYLCQNHGFLLHGTIREIPDDKLKSEQNKIFAANKSAIAIMRSIYSNDNVDLKYSYNINDDNPLSLKIHTPPDGKYISTDKGFIYIVDADSFKNKPEGSWQFVREDSEVEFHTVIETEKDDFKYSVEVIKPEVKILSSDELLELVYKGQSLPQDTRFLSVEKGGVFTYFSLKDVESIHGGTKYYPTVSVDNVIVGLAELEQDPAEHNYWIKFVSVDPEYQGKGYASALIKEIFRFAKDGNFTLEPSYYSKQGSEKLKSVVERTATETGVKLIERL